MRRKSSAADGLSESPTELIERISAEHEPPGDDTGRHRRAAVVTRGGRSAAPSTLTRRLAPLAVGAVVMLVAATVATFVSPPEQDTVAGPELSSALIPNSPAPLDIAPAAPTAGATPTTTPSTTLAPAPATTKKPATTRKPVAKAAAPVRKAIASAGDGTQAATKQGWTKVGGDEFNGTGLSGNWGPYDGAGHDGNGRRTPDAIKVGGGVVTITGDAGGNTGGMAWNDNQTYGKWEMRAKFPKGGGLYHPVLLLWPQDGWPPEIDFAETVSDADNVTFNLHYGSSNEQEHGAKDLDITQWHNYAVEWVSGKVTGYIDGQPWFESSSSQSVPSQPMHPVIQLDNFGGTSMQPAQMMVDYMRIYK